MSLLSFLFLLVSCAVYVATGKVVTVDGEPIEGVRIVSSQGVEERTGEDGTFSMKDLKDEVVLTPVLTGWSFDPPSVTVTEAREDIVFVAERLPGSGEDGWILDVTVKGNGTVTVDPSLDLYPDGTTLTLTATPDKGWIFSAWSGDLTGSDNPESLLMDQDLAVTALFDEDHGGTDDLIEVEVGGFVQRRGAGVGGVGIALTLGGGVSSLVTDEYGSFTGTVRGTGRDLSVVPALHGAIFNPATLDLDIGADKRCYSSSADRYYCSLGYFDMAILDDMTLQERVDFSRNGDTVEIPDGEYDGSLYIYGRSSLTLVSMSGGGFTMTGEGASGSGILQVQESEDIRIQDLTVSDNTSGLTSIYVRSSSVEFENLNLAGGMGAGMAMQGSTVSVDICTVHDFQGTGIDASYDRNLSLLFCEIYANGGLGVRVTGDLDMSGCSVRENASGGIVS